jgi:hypothetical protein
MKKIIKNYNNIILNKRAKYILYKRTHFLFADWLKQRKKNIYNLSTIQTEILKNIPTGNSIWVDSFGHAFYKMNKNIISFENKLYNFIFKKIKDDKKIYATDNFFSKTNTQVINKKLQPNSFVFFNCEIFRYVNIDEFIKKCEFLIQSYKDKKIIIFFDLLKIDFNRIKINNQEVIEKLKKNILNIKKFKKIDDFKYLLEIN